MGLHDAGVGVDLEECVEIAHVNRVFEQPRPGRVARTNQPQQIAMSSVGGQHVGLLVPRRIRRHVVVDFEPVVGELLDHELPALLGEVGAHEMNRLEGGIGFVHGVDLGFGVLEIGMRLPRVPGRSRLGTAAQPIFEGLQVGILAHQVVERGAAGTDESADHDGPLDGALEDFGLGAQLLLRAKSSDQNAQNHLPRHQPAVVVESGLSIVPIEENTKPFEVAGISEIVAARNAGGLFVESLFGIGEARLGRGRHGGAG